MVVTYKIEGEYYFDVKTVIGEEILVFVKLICVIDSITCIGSNKQKYFTCSAFPLLQYAHAPKLIS